MHIYAGSCSDTDLPNWNFSRSPAKYVPPSYVSLKEALGDMTSLRGDMTDCIIAEYIIAVKSQAVA